MRSNNRIKMIVGFVIIALGLNQFTYDHFNPSIEEIVVGFAWVIVGSLIIIGRGRIVKWVSKK